MRKRKVNYPVARTATKRAPVGAGGEPQPVRPTLATIDTRTREGRRDFAIGDRARITGSGFLAGEEVTVEKLAGGVVSAVVVRTASGQTRRVRVNDLEPIPASGGREAAPPTDAPEAQAATERG
jgi:hypothetical protein